MSQLWRRIQAVALSSLTVYSQAHASSFDFGMACESRGDWTKKAQVQTSNLAFALNQLKDDENCKGIVTALTAARQGSSSILHASEKSFLNVGNGVDKVEAERTPFEIKALNSILDQSELSLPDTQLIQSEIFESAFSEIQNNLGDKASTIQLARAAESGLVLMENVMGNLPAYTQCLDSHPNEALSIISASMSLANSYLGSGSGYLSRVGNSLEQFISFLRDYKFARLMRQTSEPQYWSSISCLMESAADAYCSASNGLQMLEVSKKKEEQRQKLRESDAPSARLLDGYYVWKDDVMNVSKWLLKVLTGVEPQTAQYAEFKEIIYNNVNAFKTSREKVLGVYNYQLNLIKSYTDKLAQQQEVFKLLTNIISAMNQGFGTGMNFYERVVKDDDLPFYLIGRLKSEGSFEAMVPERVVAADGKFQIPWGTYMQKTGQNGGYVEEFDDPVLLAETMGDRLRRVLDKTWEVVSEYFRSQLVIDVVNLVDNSVISQTKSVIDNLKNIHTYLSRLADEIVDGRGEKLILYSLVDTKKKIKDILDLYERNREIVINFQENYADEGKQAVKEAVLNNEELKKSFADIISRFLLNFNMVYQQNTFLLTRVSTYVKAEYAYKTKNMENLTEHQKLLLTISGDALLGRMTQVHQMSPSVVKQDLSTAQSINRANINTLQVAFDNKIYNIIRQLKMIEEGNYSHYSLFFDGLARGVKNPWAWWTSDRYRMDLMKLLEFRHVRTPEDMHNSFGAIRARLCVQTLMFESRDIFIDVCKGTVLESALGDESEELEAIKVTYNEEIAAIKSAKKLSRHVETEENRTTLKEVRENAVCAYKNYKLRDNAYLILKRLRSEATQQ